MSLGSGLKRPELKIKYGPNRDLQKLESRLDAKLKKGSQFAHNVLLGFGLIQGLNSAKTQKLGSVQNNRNFLPPLIIHLFELRHQTLIAQRLDGFALI